MPRLLIIADDFTGALDTGVQFAACGIPTRVVVGTAADMIRCECTVLVVDTETRHLSAEAAGKIVEVLARRAREAGVSCPAPGRCWPRCRSGWTRPGTLCCPLSSVPPSSSAWASAWASAGSERAGNVCNAGMNR